MYYSIITLRGVFLMIESISAVEIDGIINENEAKLREYVALLSKANEVVR